VGCLSGALLCCAGSWVVALQAIKQCACLCVVAGRQGVALSCAFKSNGVVGLCVSCVHIGRLVWKMSVVHACVVYHTDAAHAAWHSASAQRVSNCLDVLGPQPDIVSGA
jgi:hypothetical protein